MSREKRRNRLGIAAMRKLAVVYPHDGDEAELRNIRGVRVIGTHAHWHAVDQMQHVWWVGLVVMTENCIHVEVFTPMEEYKQGQLRPRQCRHEQIADDIKAKHEAMLAEYEAFGITGSGWVAAITELDEDDVLAFQRINTDKPQEDAA